VTLSLRILVAIAALAVTQTVRADECGDAVRDYNAILPQLNEAVQHFTACLANSLGRDACGKEFNGLRKAWGEFQSAVAMYKRECD